jgi:hypothetical protein
MRQAVVDGVDDEEEVNNNTNNNNTKLVSL